MSDSAQIDLGDYVLFRDQKLGKPGGQATVYRGLQKDPERPVAIKVLHSHLAEDATSRGRFRREGEAYAGLSHPNIVQVLKYGEVDGHPHLILEFVDGSDLRTWLLERHRPLPFEIALLVLRDVFDALRCAHHARPPVAHRDLKPSNVMLSQSGLVKLMDFGLALRGDVHLSQSGDVKGSPSYMSPEQTRGGEGQDAEAGARSDTFSAGVLAYELLSGSNPFERDDQYATMEAVRNDHPASLEGHNPLVPPALGALVGEMLEKDPARRPADIETAAQVLDTVIESAVGARARTLLRDYVRDPVAVAKSLRDDRIARCLAEAKRLEALGPEQADREARALACVLYVDPSHRHARARLERLRESGQVQELTLPVSRPAPAPAPRPARLAAAVVAISAILVVLLGFIGWRLLAHRAAPTPVEPTASATPAGPPPTAQAPPPSAESPAPIASIPPPVHTPSAAAQASPPATHVSPPAAHAPAPADRATAFERTYLVETRGALCDEIVVDGQRRFDGYPYPSIPLTEGTHTLQALVSDGSTRTFRYRVVRGDPAARLTLDFESGTVRSSR